MKFTNKNKYLWIIITFDTEGLVRIPIIPNSDVMYIFSNRNKARQYCKFYNKNSNNEKFFVTSIPIDNVKDMIYNNIEYATDNNHKAIVNHQCKIWKE